ncbi:uncharacterized protein METZ01_LOCUS133850, partial [marine metagenome]
MRTHSLIVGTVLASIGLSAASSASAQPTDPATRFVEVAGGYRLIPNITYLRAGGID